MREVDFRPEWYVSSLTERARARIHAPGFLLIAFLLLVWWTDAAARSRAAAVGVAQLSDALDVQGSMVAQLDRLDREIASRRRDQALLQDLSAGLPAAGVLAELSHLAPLSVSIRSLVLDKATDAERAAGSPDDALRPRKRTLGATAAAATATDRSQRTALEITGWAASGEDIANLVSGMSASPLFTDVALGYERTETLEDRVVVAFKIVCHVPRFE